MRLKNSDLLEVALAIRSYITPVIIGRGQLDCDTISKLAKEHSSHAISGELSCQIVDQYLMEL